MTGCWTRGRAAAAPASWPTPPSAAASTASPSPRRRSTSPTARRPSVAWPAGSVFTSRTCSTPASRPVPSNRSGTTSPRCTSSWMTSSRHTPGCSPAAADMSPSPAATTTCTGCRPRRSPASTPITCATSIRAAATFARWPRTGLCPSPSSTSRPPRSRTGSCARRPRSPPASRTCSWRPTATAASSTCSLPPTASEPPADGPLPTRGQVKTMRATPPQPCGAAAEHPLTGPFAGAWRGLPSGPGTAAVWLPALLAAARPSREDGLFTSPLREGSVYIERPWGDGSRLPLYCPVPERVGDGPTDEVEARLATWARDRGFQSNEIDALGEAAFGRLVTLAHPDTDDPDALLITAQMNAAWWAADDYYA